MNIKHFLREFIDKDILKFGSFLMKQGVYSPIYVDLRCMISYPAFVKELSKEIWQKKMDANIEADSVCGVPYTALPIATTIQVLYDIPMVLRRKEIKTYGTKKILEGNFRKGQKCLIIEDVMTSGGSILETAKILRAEGLIVTDCIVILDREQGGPGNLIKDGITVHSVFKLKSVLNDVLKFNMVDEELVQKALQYLDDTSFSDDAFSTETISNLPFKQQVEACSHPVLKKLFHIIDQKKTNLCVAVDVIKSSELLLLADNLGPHICLLKTHIDIVENFSEHVPKSLRHIAEKHNFLILEDRKFADIGSTVEKQYKGGVYKIHDWADIVTVHSLPGDGIIEGLKNASSNKACVLVAEMSSNGAINTQEYIEKTLDMANRHKDFVIGFISQSKVSKTSDFIHICPGIHLDSTDDTLGQQYKTPEIAIKKHGATIVVVGRGITRSKNVIESVIKYKEAAYNAYTETTI